MIYTSFVEKVDMKVCTSARTRYLPWRKSESLLPLPPALSTPCPPSAFAGTNEDIWGVKQ